MLPANPHWSDDVPDVTTVLLPAIQFILMIVGATTVLFGSVLLLLWLSGHIAFITYDDEDEEDANS